MPVKSVTLEEVHYNRVPLRCIESCDFIAPACCSNREEASDSSVYKELTLDLLPSFNPYVAGLSHSIMTISRYARLAHQPVKHLASTPRRNLAQVSDARVAPFLLEDMAKYKNGQEEELPPFVISRERGFLPRKVSRYIHNYAESLANEISLGPSCPSSRTFLQCGLAFKAYDHPSASRQQWQSS